MITVICKGHGRIEQRINGLYRRNSAALPARGEHVRIVITLLNVEIDAVVCEVDEMARTYDVSLLENPYVQNFLLEKIRRKENLEVVDSYPGKASSVRTNHDLNIGKGNSSYA